VAQTKSEGAGAEDVYLIRTDSEGSPVWERTVGGPGTDRVFAITRSSEGRFVAAGISKETPDVQDDVYVISFGEDGEIDWEKRFGGEGRDVGHGIATLPGGDLLVTGYGSSWAEEGNDVYLLRLSADGELEWRTTYGGPGEQRGMMSGIAPDGSIVVIGYEGEGATLEPMLIGLDSNGEMLWKKVLARPGPDRGVMVRPTRDGGWILTGGFASQDDYSFDLEILKFRIVDDP